MEIITDSKSIRYILQNAGRIKNDCKCIECDGTGWYNYDENGEDVQNGYSDSIDRQNEECEECNGVGYIYW